MTPGLDRCPCAPVRPDVLVTSIPSSWLPLSLQTVRYAAGALRNVAVEEAGRQQVLVSVGALARLQGACV